MNWTIENQNDTGPNDEGFWEWWEVSNRARTFKCDDREDAEWLCDLLNQQAPPPATAPEHLPPPSAPSSGKGQ